MSKRSYRRLAVVAGAALAVGSVAPAMAAQVNATGAGRATIDVSDLAIPSTGSLIPGALLADAQDFALGTVFGAQDLASDTASGLQDEVSGLVEELLSATSGVSVGLLAGANANTGGATVSVGGAAVGGAGLLGLVPDPSTALSGVQGQLAPLAEFGTDTVDGALLLVDEAKGTAMGTGSGVLLTGLGLVDTASVSVNAIAALMASL